MTFIFCAKIYCAFSRRRSAAAAAQSHKRETEKELRALAAAWKSGASAYPPVGEHWRSRWQNKGLSGRGARRAWDLVANEHPELKSPKGGLSGILCKGRLINRV